LLKSSQKILTKGCNVCRAVIEDSVIFFAVYTAAETPSHCFLMGQTTLKNCPFPWEYLGPRESAPQTVSGSVLPFCRAHEGDQQTDRHGDRPRYSIYSNGPHLAICLIGLKFKHVQLTVWTS